MSKRDFAFAGVVAITIACFCALLFWPGTFGGRLLATYDGLLQAIPAIDAPARLWEPNLSLGFPLYADPDEAFFYPLAMVMRALHSHFNLYFIAPIAIAIARATMPTLSSISPNNGALTALNIMATEYQTEIIAGTAIFARLR